MDAAAFLSLATACAPGVDPATAAAIVSVESSFNPYAIGVVGGVLERQPRSEAEAVATAKALQAGGWNYSVGLAQINSGNFSRLGLSAASAIAPCANLRAMQVVLSECLRSAEVPSQAALRRALSCYYSGDSETGFRNGYVARVVAAARKLSDRPGRP